MGKKKESVLLSIEDRNQLAKLQERAEMEDQIKAALMTDIAVKLGADKKDAKYILEWIDLPPLKDHFAKYIDSRKAGVKQA